MKHSGILLFLAGFVTAVAAGWTVIPAALYSKVEQPAQFSHKVHKDKASMKCEDCHSISEDGTFAGISRLENCAGCHAEPVGETPNEKAIVANYVKPGREIPWRVYSRQPVNARFSHAIHLKTAKLACERCHGGHGDSDGLPAYYENRISGESRGIWGPKMLRIGLKPGEGMKMSDCESCHADRGVGAGCLGCHK